ncbi:MAG: small subunit ribosomal protein [Thermoproteota archaeon]|nr:small subunit ribosomal protein [Thermoproteota archaeon]
MRNIGITVEPPKRECEDLHCPFHGTLSTRGRVLEGIVVSDHMKGTIVLRRDYYHYVPKYLRYERRHSRLAAHIPPCIDAKIGEKVKIIECRPLSKSVSFVVIEKVGEE